jgi:DNA mismatch repair protein MutS
MNSYNSYQAIKAQYPQHIVIMRIGDFYEAFDEDAKRLAKACDLTLTGSSILGRPICGFPYHQAERMMAKGLESGETFAVADVVVHR